MVFMPSNRRPAGFWIRFVASLIDTGILFFSFSVILLVFSRFLGLEKILTPISVQTAFFCVLSCVYYTVLTARTGRTWGKQVLDIRVINVDGTPVGYGKSFLRWCAYAVSYATLLIGFFLAGWDKRKRALHDFLSGTEVAHEILPYTGLDSRGTTKHRKKRFLSCLLRLQRSWLSSLAQST